MTRRSLRDVTADVGPMPDLIPERPPDDASGGRPDARPDARAPARPDARTGARPDARARGRADARAREKETPGAGAWRRTIEVEARRYAAAAARLATRDAELAAAIAAAIAAGYPAGDARALLDEIGVTGGPYPASAAP